MELNNREHRLDQWLDKALKQYGAAEPRPGLENRVLASLRGEREHAVPRRGIWWPALAVLAAMLLISAAVLVMRNHGGVERTSVGNRTEVPRPGKQPQTPTALNAGVARRTRTQVVARVSPPGHRTEIPAAPPPRLEQFPSPQPLSEQEALLALYVQEFPREAVLMAKAHTELLKREEIEQSGAWPGDSIQEDSQPENP